MLRPEKLGLWGRGKRDRDMEEYLASRCSLMAVNGWFPEHIGGNKRSGFNPKSGGEGKCGKSGQRAHRETRGIIWGRGEKTDLRKTKGENFTVKGS